jgi:hypothetical protein
MPIKVQCACGKAFAAKDELAGKTVKCPGCQKPVKIPGGQASAAQPKPAATKQAAAKPAAAGTQKSAPAKGGGADLFDEVGLQAAAAGTQPCPGCSEPMPIQAVVCIKCGYNTRIGRRMETLKERGESGGHEGHGAVAQDLLNRAAAVMDDDLAEEKKKTKEGLPWWVYLIILLVLVAFAIWMLFNWGIEKPKDDQKAFLAPSVQRVVV